MNLKSLLISFAFLGAASATALAKPATVTVQGGASFQASWSAQPGVIVRDHRDAPRYIAPAPKRFVKPLPFVAPQITNTKIVSNPSYTWTMYTGPVYQTSSRGFSQLTDPTRLERNRQDFVVNGARARTLQLRGLSGQTAIEKVVIEYADGSKKIVQLDRTLGRNVINIDINGGSMNRIFVYGNGSANSAYQLFVH